MLGGIASYAQDAGTSPGTGIFWLATVIGLWKMFEKAGQPGWAAIIPLYNQYKLCEITMNNPWYWLRLLVFAIPVVGWIAGLYFLYQIAKATALAYGKPEGWTWGYFFLTPVFYCITGFDDSEYYGPMGSGDHRSGAARAAKTVDFDVTRNDQANTYTDYSQDVKVEAYNEDTVNFTVDERSEDNVNFDTDQTFE